MKDALAPLALTLQALIESVRGLRTLQSESEVEVVRADLLKKIVEAQKAVMALHAAVAAVQQEVAELKEENARLRDWSEERERFALRAVDTGAFVYVPRPFTQGPEPPHWLCPHCFANCRKSVLQCAGQVDPGTSGLTGGVVRWSCSVCHNELRIRSSISPENFRPGA